MRAWLLALASCGAAPTVIGNRAPIGAQTVAHARPAADRRYAGCDETGCPLQLREALPVDPQLAVLPPFTLPVDPQVPPLAPPPTDLEREIGAQHRRLIVENRFEY